MEEKITFTINGEPRTVEVEPETMLVDVIRDVLNLTGTKRGCDNATCGTCMVVVNGKAVKSCNTPVKKVAGAEILTVEGLAGGASCTRSKKPSPSQGRSNAASARRGS